jgi:hypothetical protein
VPERIQIRLNIDFAEVGKIAPGRIFPGKMGSAKFAGNREILAG